MCWRGLPSGGIILHRDIVPLKIETDGLYSAMLDKASLSEVVGERYHVP